MSGFYGYIAKKDFLIEKNLLDQVIQHLSSRGPKIERIGLKNEFHVNASSHKSLIDTTDLILIEDCLINLDGRIDNRKELLSYVSSNKNISDAHLIHSAYKKWGKDFVKYIVGQFSIVIHDLYKNIIYLVRDHLGTIPLYYSHKAGIFAYGTEPNFLLDTKLANKQVNEDRIKSFILKSQDFYDLTYYEEIQKVKPAHVLTITETNIIEEQYFSFERDEKKTFDNDDDWINKFKETLEDRVSTYTSGMEKVGLSLSGGLDSNSILGMLRCSNVSEIHCYYARFIDLKGQDYKNSDEDKYVASISKNKRIKINNVDIPEIDVITEINNNQKGKPEPDYDATRHIQTRVNARCKEDGCKILFTGFDGDIIVSHGYEKIFNDVRKGKFINAYQEFKMDRDLKKIDHSPFHFISRFILPTFTPYFIKHLYKSFKKDLLPDHAAYFAARDLRNKISYKDSKRIFDASGSRVLGHQLEIFNSRFWQHHFEILDYDVAYQGLEYRHPFMDRNMMSFCLNIPMHLRRKDGFNRFIMRKAMAQYVPKEIINRVTKSHVGEYYNYSLKRNFAIMKEMLVNSPEPIKQHLDLERIKIIDSDNASRLQLISFQHICALVAWYNANFS